MLIALDQLKKIILTNPHPEIWLVPINTRTTEYDISSTEQLAAFLANAVVETGELNHLEENLNYSQEGLSDTFPSHFTPAQAIQYARQPEKIANRAYASRMGNGDEASGDGWKYRGRGIMQTTGKSNYTSLASELHLGLVDDPDTLKQPDIALESACVYWRDNNLNAVLANHGFEGVVRKINGGTEGLDRRRFEYVCIMQILNREQ